MIFYGHKSVTHREPGSLSAWEWKNSEDALKAYTALFGLLAIGQIPAMRHVKYADLPYFIGLASMTIYIGAHRGLCTKVRQQITIKEVQTMCIAVSIHKHLHLKLSLTCVQQAVQGLQAYVSAISLQLEIMPYAFNCLVMFDVSRLAA